ncbi:hypothetical protein [Burkholderia gladioli]|uniref:hypothetical protein n=1 Tax=Burkholderia gladioli TaxID=28095 RepID=UPI001C233AA7|nr:hypothetical protein [Burkholderia gladioli]MBU9191574.1 hypothetical protein [Burkholderia gladioli]
MNDPVRDPARIIAQRIVGAINRKPCRAYAFGATYFHDIETPRPGVSTLDNRAD